MKNLLLLLFALAFACRANKMPIVKKNKIVYRSIPLKIAVYELSALIHYDFMDSSTYRGQDYVTGRIDRALPIDSMLVIFNACSAHVVYSRVYRTIYCKNKNK